MDRRDFITLLGSAAAAVFVRPLTARAQQPGTIRRIGYVTSASESDVEARARLTAFLDALAKLGWLERRDIRMEYHWNSDNPDRRRAAAAELVRSEPNVILAQSTLNVEALLRETRTIPIVMLGATDPVSSGLVTSIAHPGGNVTGFTNFDFPMGGKWLEILKEVAPGIKRVLVLLNPENAGQAGLLQAIEAAALSFGVQTVAASTALGGSAIERAISAFAEQPNGGLVVPPNTTAMENRGMIVELAMRHRLPAIYPFRPYVASGGLMSYDTDIYDIYRRAASSVDRILRAEKPGDLPVQNPTKFELVINLKVAKALGLTVPLALLARADEVIE